MAGFVETWVDRIWQAVDGDTAWASMTSPKSWAQFSSPSTFNWDRNTTPFAHPTVVVLSLILYISSSFGLQALMTRLRKNPLEITALVVVHNLILCIGSLALCIAMSLQIHRAITVTYAGTRPCRRKR